MARAVTKNPDLLREAERMQRSIDFRDGPAAQQAIDKVLTSLSPKDKAEVKDIVNHY